MQSLVSFLKTSQKLEVPDHVVPVGRQDQSPGEDGEAQDQAGDDREDHRHQEINEEGDEGPESEDGGHDDDDHHVCHQPGQEELSPGQPHSYEEKDGGCEVRESGQGQQGEHQAGLTLHLLQPPQHAPADLEQGGFRESFCPFFGGGGGGFF